MTSTNPDDPAREARLAVFESRAYGLFLHWGLYSLLERGEWVRFHHQLDPEEYDSLARRFTAENFDAPALVNWAKGCGFRYICLTARHHEGFSLYDTRGLNTFDALHTAAGRDLVGELAQACHAGGMGLFLYHTTLDWWEPRFDTDWKAYLAYLRDSVRILCTHYGKIDGLWFDGNWARKDRDWEEEALYRMIRELQPDCMIINNSSLGAPGEEGHPMLDAVTFEQGLPVKATARRMAKEMCQTLASHWGVAKNDYSHKSPADVINDLVTCRGHGANLLLNAGPKADGSISDIDRLTLERAGEWIRGSLGEVLYSGRPAGLRACGRDVVLRDRDDLYYCAFDLPIDKNAHLHAGRSDWDRRTLTGGIPAVKQIIWLDNGEELPFVQNQPAGLLAFKASAFPYGEQQIIRIAKISL
ncbi:MAG: alpha-L-fucosidase [Oceanipulchritudo sp.]